MKKNIPLIIIKLIKKCKKIKTEAILLLKKLDKF